MLNDYIIGIGALCGIASFIMCLAISYSICRKREFK